jgi:hypothetical protein
MVERCGDRQRKFDGLEKWPFRLFIESLPIMLQIALLLLTCGLSRYMWLVNASVARVVISFTVLGALFYAGIVGAGTSSYECPFQTPVSIGLRHLKDSGTIRKLLASLSPLNVIRLTYATWRNSRKGLALASHRVYAIWRNTRQELTSASHHINDTVQSLSSLEISLPHILFGIRGTVRKVGHQTIVLLLRIDRAFGNAKHRLAQGIRRFRRTLLLPINVEGVHHQPLVPQGTPGLRVRVWDLETLQKQNMDNARCVCWVLRNITDPEAIDSAIRLAGTIRWFDGGSDHGPPFDFIVSTFEACFDSNRQPYHGMRDRAYFSARAILQINLRARAQSHERASKYPIPTISSAPVQHIDPDFHHVIRMLECNLQPGNPTLDFPRGDTTTRTHSLWMSNLFVDLTCMGPNPTLKSYPSYLSVAFTDHQAMIADTLLMWYMFLGGYVEEETMWAVDKLYVVISFFPSFRLPKIVHTSDSLETILSHLSARVMKAIADANSLNHLHYLLEFLAAWEDRPVHLTLMVYQWCSAISEAAGRLEWSDLTPTQPILLRVRQRLQDPTLGEASDYLPSAEDGFSEVGPGCDLVRSDHTSNRLREGSQYLITARHVDLLPTALEIGFGLVRPLRNQPALRLDHTPHHDRMFEATFSSGDDEVVANAVCVWVVCGDRAPLGSCMRYLAKHVERGTPISARLRQMSIHAIEHTWRSELEVSGPETVFLLNRLNVDVDDMVEKDEWVQLLVGTICLPPGPESLSSHYWCLLDKLPLAADFLVTAGSRKMEVMRSLEEAEDWEKLEVWMVVVWQALSSYNTPLSMMEDIEQATLKLLSQRPSALPRFKDLCLYGFLLHLHKGRLRGVCDQAQAGQSSPESSPPYVSVRLVQHQSFLTLPFFFASVNRSTASHSFPFPLWETTLSENVCCIVQRVTYLASYTN